MSTVINVRPTLREKAGNPISDFLGKIMPRRHRISRRYNAGYGAGVIGAFQSTMTRPVAFETLESRLLLSTITWTNRNDFAGGADGTNDNNFDVAFDYGDVNDYGEAFSNPRFRNQAIAVIDAAIADWERVITSFNYSDPTQAFQLTLSMFPTARGLGSSTPPGLTGYTDGKPSSATINIGCLARWVISSKLEY